MGTADPAVDTSGNHHRARLVRAQVVPAAGFSGAVAIHGRGSTVMVAAAPAFNLRTGLTLEAWVRAASRVGGNLDVIVKSGKNGRSSYGLVLRGMHPTAYIRVAGRVLRATTRSRIARHSWMFLAATYDGSSLQLYVNGRPAAHARARGRIAESAGPVRIGGDDLRGRKVVEMVSDVRIFSGARSRRQIRADGQRPASPVHGPNAPVSAPLPVGRSSAPLLSGGAVEGQTLSVSTGGWSNGPTGYGYQWYGCDAVGLNCVPITGATSSSYTPTQGDVGHPLYAVVTAANAAGSATTESWLSPAVQLAPYSPPAAANLWISSVGGSCTRSATPTAFNPATACGSLGAAYGAAGCGDTVLIGAGDYSGTDQQLNDRRALDSCTAPVTFEPAVGGTVDFASINFGTCCNLGGASWVTLRNITEGGTSAGLNGNHQELISFTTCTSECSSPVVPSHDTLDGIQGGAVVADADDLVVENSSFGPCWSDSSASTSHPCVHNMYVSGGTNQTWIRDTFHDFTITTNHFECFFLQGGEHIMFDADTWYDCQLYALMMNPWVANDPIEHVTVQNSWFYRVQNGGGAANPRAIDFETESSTVDNFVVRYNSLAPGEGIYNEDGLSNVCPGGGCYAVGNIGDTEGCVPGFTYAYNVWENGTCASTDRVDRTLPYVNQALGDLHLLCNANILSFVNPSSTINAVDYTRDGSWRDPTGPLDAGADGRTSCGL